MSEQTDLNEEKERQRKIKIEADAKEKAAKDAAIPVAPQGDEEDE